MPRTLAIGALAIGPILGAIALASALGGCATPRELKRPPRAPIMTRPAEANPLPTYAIPDPKPHAEPQPDQVPPP